MNGRHAWGQTTASAGAQTPQADINAEEHKPEDHQVSSGGNIRLGTVNGSPVSLADFSLDGLQQDSPEEQTKANRAVKRVEFVAAPIPIISPTVGNGLAVAGAVAVSLNRKDRKSPPSLFGVGLASTSNGTRGFALLSQLFVKEDRFRILTLFAKGNVNYHYFGSGSSGADRDLYLPLELRLNVFVAEPKVRIVDRWFVGPRYFSLRSVTNINVNKLLDQFPNFPTNPDFPEVPPLDFNLRVAALGARVQFDSRDSQFYPRQGAFFDSIIDFYEPTFGSDRSYQRYDFAYQAYHGIGERGVLAYRANTCIANGRVPFFDGCNFGDQKDVMGYPLGMHQDRRMIVGQVQYRRELFWRIGMAGFFGMGQVARKFSDFNASSILPGGGVGLRFLLAKQNHINLSLDYAWGRNSTAFYFSVGESF